MSKIVVTGANGFVGARLCTRLDVLGHEVIAIVRSPTQAASGISRTITVADWLQYEQWAEAFRGADAVVHLAGRAHHGEAVTAADRALFWQTNVEATRALIMNAAAAGVRNVVFVSSSKVYPETREAESAPSLSAHDQVAPDGVYAASKLAAEQVLQKHAAQHGIALTILRPPLIYGPGNKGNLLSLMRAIERGLPLPFKSIQNKRSFIYIDNFIEAIVRALRRTDTGSKVYTLADCALSTSELIEFIARGMQRRPRLLRCPSRLLWLASALVGRTALYARLTQSLVLDDSDIRRDLHWQPVRSSEEGFAMTGAWFRALSGDLGASD